MQRRTAWCETTKTSVFKRSAWTTPSTRCNRSKYDSPWGYRYFSLSWSLHANSCGKRSWISSYVRPSQIPALISLRSLRAARGPGIFCTVWIVRRSSDVQIKRGFGPLGLLPGPPNCLARFSPYFRPLADKSASPPILPRTLNSDSPCCREDNWIN